MQEKNKIDEEIIQRFLDQSMNQWINPEIEKRKKEGLLSEKFVLQAAQVLFFPDPALVEVKINNEVKGIARAIAKRNIEKGETVKDTDISEIESIDVSEFYPDAAHLTVLFFPGRLICAFDFRYNKNKIKEILAAADEFYQSALENLKNKRLRPFFDNSFSCAELCATAILFTVPDKLLLTKEGGHKHRRQRLVGWTRLGNSKSEFLTLFEKLHECRSSARYLEDDKFQKENAEEIAKTLMKMLDFAKENIN